jgi:hypothetical protein
LTLDPVEFPKTNKLASVVNAGSLVKDGRCQSAKAVDGGFSAKAVSLETIEHSTVADQEKYARFLN